MQSEKTKQEAQVPFSSADFNEVLKKKISLLIQSAAHAYTCFQDEKTNILTGNMEGKPALHRPKRKFGFYQYLLADKTKIQPNSYTNMEESWKY